MQEEFAKISPGERYILEAVRSLKPYEEMRLVADKDGKPDNFFVVRTSKTVVKGMFIEFMK